LGLGKGIDGCNKPRELHTIQGVKAIACFNQSLALTESGQLYFWGKSPNMTDIIYVPQPIISLPNKIVKIFMGRSMGACTDSKDILWVFGENSEGELGLGDRTARLNPYPVIPLQGKPL
jgi:alpha-tubulin suppressor-like RCC1 family protein